MNKLGKILLNYLIKGLLVVLPIAVSVILLVWAVSTVDSWINLNNILGVNPATGASRNIPGLGLLSVIAVVLVTGFFVTNLVTEPMYKFFRRLTHRLPLFNFIYTSIKDLTEAFVGEQKKFNHPVLVEVEGGLKKIGFLTQNHLEKFNLPTQVAVYFPLSYSFAGQLCIVERDKVTDLKMSAADAMKLVVSGGISGL
ncbi:MAG: DUF502 domain-containing protein [Pedobacter sp.]|nr:DUF502 domain-containing protein [Pedobacter sp.]